jgi:hypothetical protein
MVTADEMELALRALKFDRMEKVYVAKLRTKVSDHLLARQLGTTVKEFRKSLLKARRGAARKVLYRCKKGSRIDADRFQALHLASGANKDLAKEFRLYVPKRGNLDEREASVLDSFLRGVFMSELWAKSFSWTDHKKNGKAHARRIRARHQTRYTAGQLTQISWEEVGEGVLNDTPKGSPTWQHWRSVIQRNANDREKKSLVNMLGHEMELLYGRYRRSLERMGGRTGTFTIYGGEKRHARQVAEHCLMRDVHPVDLLKYWNDRIGDFTDLKYPTLAFLKSSTSIEEVASASLKNGAKPKDGNSYSNLNGLDPTFRRRLEAAGFPTQKYADRMLTSIQFMAIQKAKGHTFFIDEPDQRKMIAWAAKEIFSS